MFLGDELVENAVFSSIPGNADESGRSPAAFVGHADKLSGSACSRLHKSPHNTNETI